MEETRMEYILELRKKFMWTSILTILIFILSFSQTSTIIGNLLSYYEINAINLSPAESISISLNFALGISMIFFLPMLFIQLFNFSKELIDKKYHKEIIVKILLGFIFALIGFTIGITFFGKMILNGLLVYNIGTAMWSISSILKTTSLFGLAIAVSIQMIWFIPLLTKTNIIKKEKLKEFRLYFITGLLIVSALITPPDAYSMIIMMLPIYGSFELGILFSKPIYIISKIKYYYLKIKMEVKNVRNLGNSFNNRSYNSCSNCW